MTSKLFTAAPPIALILALILALIVTPAVVADPAEEIGLIELFNYFEYSTQLASSGQPTKAQLPLLKEANIGLVVNLAPVTEPGAYADEGELIKARGIDYAHMPIEWEAPTEANIRAFFSVMEQAKDKRVLVHCYANARASAFSYLWRVLKAGDDARGARQDLITIWDYNEGYELRNVPTWSALIEQAEQQDW